MRFMSLITSLRAAAAAGIKAFRLVLAGEPIFMLRATDQLAEKSVRDWAARAAIVAEAPRVPGKKIAGALDIADAMKRWPSKRLPD